MSETIKENISKNIAKFRKVAGLSQKELAEKIGAKNLTTVSSWERGISSPDADKIIQLCTLLNVTLYDLYNVDYDEDILSHQEKQHIKKYRVLTDSGKEMVDLVLEKEYERVLSKVEPSPAPHHIQVAAYSGTGVETIDLTEEEHRLSEEAKKKIIFEDKSGI